MLWWFAAVEAEQVAPEPDPDIEFVGSAQSFSDTVTIPAGHDTDDLLVIVAHTEGSGTPSAPGGQGWTLHSGASRTGAGAKNWRVYSKVATSESETSGTWSGIGGTGGLICHVYRNASGLGAGDKLNDGNSNPDIPSLTLNVTDGSSWVMYWAMALASEAWSSFNRRQLLTGDSNNAVSFDTDAGVASWSGQSNISNSNSADWGSMAVEILKRTS